MSLCGRLRRVMCVCVYVCVTTACNILLKGQAPKTNITETTTLGGPPCRT